MLLNALMQKERQMHLKDNIGNKANGYYDRKLVPVYLAILIFLCQEIEEGNFVLLPSEWQKADDSFKNFISNLVLQSYSPNKIRALVNSMNLPYSAEQIEEIKEDLYLKAKEVKTKELAENVFAVFIDAYHTSIDTNWVKEAVIYTMSLA